MQSSGRGGAVEDEVALGCRGGQVEEVRPDPLVEVVALGLDPVMHGGHVSPRAEALLYAADKAHHVDELIRPTLARGIDVITDRYTDSSVAYQGAGRDLGPQEIHDLLDWAVGGLFPDLTIVVDVPAAVGRMSSST